MELLVRVVSKTNDKDPVLDSKLTKAGDVICYKPDGSDWGIQEIKNPEWRIIRVPDMTEKQAMALVAEELPPTLDKQYPLLQRRAMRLDLTQLDALTAGKITLDQATKVALIDQAVDDVSTGKISDADLKSTLIINKIDATVQAVDVMAIASLKPALKEDIAIQIDVVIP